MTSVTTSLRLSPQPQTGGANGAVTVQRQLTVDPRLGRLLCNRLSANGIDSFMVPAIALHVAQIQKAQAEAPGPLVSRQAFKPICDLFVLIAQHRAVSVAGLADLERTAGQSYAD